jgi:hypothetical protein
MQTPVEYSKEVSEYKSMIKTLVMGTLFVCNFFFSSLTKTVIGNLCQDHTADWFVLYSTTST